MDDRDAVARDMERIFGPAGGLGVPPATATGLLAARRGHAAVWLAVAMAATGIAVVATDRLRSPVPPAVSPPAPIAAPAPVASRVPAAITATAAPAIRHEPSVTVRRVRPPRPPRPAPAPTVRAARPAPSPRPVRLEAPHLTGEALRRALAEDVVITRRLNQQALDRQRAAAPVD